MKKSRLKTIEYNFFKKTLTSWNPNHFLVESRLYLSMKGSKYLLLNILAENTYFTASLLSMLWKFKSKVKSKFDANLYFLVAGFIEWET